MSMKLEIVWCFSHSKTKSRGKVRTLLSFTGDEKVNEEIK